MQLDNNQKAFFELLRAGLWEKEARLSELKGIDYYSILRLAEEQSVVGLVTAGLERTSDVKIPKDVVRQFIGGALRLEQRNTAMNAFIAGLIEQLRAADVYAVLVKGQGIAQCYERPLWRACGDVDLLLSDSGYEKAKEVLMPQVLSYEQEYTSFKHLGMMMSGFMVELHGTQHTRLSRRVDNMIDSVQKDVLNGGNVRTWVNGGVTLFLPAPDSDVIFVFTHILHHFFFEGVGLRQICDWCRLLWKYCAEIDAGLLEKRLLTAGLISEWKAFAAFAVEYLEMPVETIPLYCDDRRWSRKGAMILADVLKVGNFGYKQRRDYRGQYYLVRKFNSFRCRLSDMLRHFKLFPKDSIVFLGGLLRTGLHAAVRGE